MAGFKTIDNLGVEISSRYAHTQEDENQLLVKESKQVSSRSRIEVSRLSYASAYDTLMGVREKGKQWAAFGKPMGFESGSSRVFGNHLFMAIRSDEFGLIETDRIKAKRDTSKEKRKKRLNEKKQINYDWEEQYEDDEEERESSALLQFFDELCEKEKTLIEVNGRRRQYQKG